MSRKQRFPYLVLAILSLILLVAIPAGNLVSLRSQTDVLQQLGPSFQLRTILQILLGGLGKAALLLVCIWLGAGIDHLLFRIKDSPKRRLATLGFIFGSLFLCVVLPVISLVFTYAALSPKDGWEQLPAPPETAVTIAGGIYNLVIIETENENYYSHVVPDTGQGWQTDKKPDASFLPETDQVDSPGIQAPGTFISLVGVPSYPGSTQKIYYGILEDHTIWYLASKTGNAVITTALLTAVLFPVLIGGLIMLLGMGAMSLLRWLAGRIWRAPETITV